MAGLLASRRRFFARHARPMILRRTGQADLPVQGVEAAFQPAQLTGDVRQGDSTIGLLPDEIVAASWPAPVRARDAIYVSGQTKQILGAWPLYDGPVFAGWKLWVRGGTV